MNDESESAFGLAIDLANKVRILESQLSAAKSALEWVHRENQNAHRSNIKNVCATALELIDARAK